MKSPDHDSVDITVILPTYNRSELLHRAVASVLNQTLNQLELIVIDDGSTDHTATTVEKFAAKDPRVIYIRTEHAGACKARNAGIDRARGKYIAFQDSDDYWQPHFLETLHKIARSRNDQDVVFCTHLVQHIDGRMRIKPDRLIDQPNSTILSGNIVSTQTALVPRRLLSDRIRFDEQLLRYQDWDLWLQMIRASDVQFFHVHELLVCMQRQPDSISQGSERIRRASVLRILRKHHSAWKCQPCALAKVLWLLVKPSGEPTRGTARAIGCILERIKMR